MHVLQRNTPFHFSFTFLTKDFGTIICEAGHAQKLLNSDFVRKYDRRRRLHILCSGTYLRLHHVLYRVGCLKRKPRTSEYNIFITAIVEMFHVDSQPKSFLYSTVCQFCSVGSRRCCMTSEFMDRSRPRNAVVC